MAMAMLKWYYFLWFLGFSKFQKELVKGFICGRSFKKFGFELRTQLVHLLRKDKLSSVPFQCLWTSSRTALSPREPWSTCTITALLLGNRSPCSTCKMGIRQMDNQENPSLVISHPIVGKAQREHSALMLSQNCSLKIFLFHERNY